MHQGDGDGPQGRPGKAAVARAQDGPSGVHVDVHRRDGVGYSQGVGSGGNCGVGYLRYVGYVGRQLGPDRQVGLAADAGHGGFGEAWMVAEHRPIVNIGATQVQLNGGESFHTACHRGHLFPLLRTVPGHAHDDVGIHCRPTRGQVGHGGLDPRVGQSNGVQQGGFSNDQSFPKRSGEPTGFRVAAPGVAGERFGQHRAQRGQGSIHVDPPSVAVVAKGARRDHNRIGQQQPRFPSGRQVHRQVHSRVHLRCKR